MLVPAVAALVMIPVLGRDLEAPKPFVTALGRTTGEERWKRIGEQPGVWTVVDTAKDLVYVAELPCLRGGAAGMLVARDQDDGEVRWRTRYDGYPYELSSYSVDARTVVVARGDELVGLDAETGERRWEQPRDGFRPRAGDARLVLVQNHQDNPVDFGDPETAGEIRALDRDTGELRWTFRSTVRSSPPHPAGGLVLVDPQTAVADFSTFAPATGPSGEQVGIDLSSGELLWSVPLGQRIGAMKDVGVLLASTTGVSVSALDPRTREVLWTTSEDSMINFPTDVDGRLFTTGRRPDDKHFAHLAIDERDGDLLWEYGGPRGHGSSTGVVAAGRGLVVFAPPSGSSGPVVGVDGATGEPRWRRARPEGAGLNWHVGRDVYQAGGCTAVGET